MAVMLFLFLLILQCGQQSKVNTYQKGALATAAPIATQVGETVFEAGGNAFDVAVAVGFALAVVHPEAGNIGGGGFVVIREGHNGEVRSLDFREKAPAAAHENMFLDSNGNVIQNMSLVGANAVGVPGSVAGLYELWREYCTIEWDSLISFSITLADTGFILDDYQSAHFKKYRDKLLQFKETAELFFPDGKTLEPGDRLIQKDLARTLTLIASEGPNSFYTGSIADSLVATIKRYGGIVTREDLRNYSVVWREPISIEFDSFQIYTMPPPSSGGIVIGQILKILEYFDLDKLSPDSVTYIHLFCEAARLAYADRSEHLGDPDFYHISEKLLSNSYLVERAALISKDHANTSQDIRPGELEIDEAKETTHFSVADESGNIVSFTYTLNASYGSKLAVRGSGFLLNNEMDDFAIAPGHANLYGLIGNETNKVESGKRMLSSMSPTIAFKNKKPFLVLGSSGGSQIITGVTQVLLNIILFDLSAEEAVAQARIHHQWLPDVLEIEQNSFDIHVKQGLINLGHHIEEFNPISEIQLVYIDSSGLMRGVSDPRNNGLSSGF